MTTKPAMRGVAGLLGTGVLAGGAMYAAMAIGPQVEGRGGEVGATIAVAGIVGCSALLAWAWWPLAPGPKATGAALTTGVLFFLTSALVITVAADPYESIVCAEAGAADYCGLGVLGFVPTIGAIVPWTLAGTPALLALLAARRRHRSSSFPQAH